MLNTRHASLLLLLLLAHPVSANSERDSEYRFAVWAGAGSGLLVSQESAIPFRLSAGAEMFFRNFRHVAIGYRGMVLASGDEMSHAGGASSMSRMAHYFPHFRCFLVKDMLSLQFAPGLAISHRGGMLMGSGNTNAGSVATFAAHLGTEVLIPLERKISVGLEAAYDYLAASNGSDSFPRTNVFSLSANLRFALGGWE